MTSTTSTATALSRTAFATLLLIALMMGANHVAARLAFDHGADVATAVALRSGATAVVVGLLVVWQRVPLNLNVRSKRALLVIGLLLGVQSLSLYSAVARLPVALALLAFNTYPLWTALWARLIYRHRAEPRGRQGRERALEAPDRRAHGARDDDVLLIGGGHGCVASPVKPQACGVRSRADPGAVE